MMSLWVLLVFFSFAFCTDTTYIPLTRNSFSGPFLNNIPNWRLVGHATIENYGSNYLDLTPEKPDQRGGVWNQVTLKPRDWEVQAHVSFGSQPQNGKIAAGMAIWLTKEKETTGTSFGSHNVWNGLAVIFDTFDNNNDGNHPLIYAVWNDGNHGFDHTRDEQQQNLLVLGQCHVTRQSNAEFIIKIQYLDQRLTIQFQNKLVKGAPFENCLSAPIQIPRGYYLGLSANTGGFVDHHKVHSLQVHSLRGEYEQFDDNIQHPQGEVADTEAQYRRQFNNQQQQQHHQQQQQQQYYQQHQQQQQQQHQQQQFQQQAQHNVDMELKEKIELQIKKHIDLESAIAVLAQEADELFANLEKKASDELRELQNKVVLLHPEVEALANAKPNIDEIETSIKELQSALEHLEMVTNAENAKIDSLGTGFFFLPSSNGWDKWVWLLVIQSIGIILFILIQKCRKPKKGGI